MDDFTFCMKTKGERSHVDQVIGRRVILIWTLKKYDERIWTDLPEMWQGLAKMVMKIRFHKLWRVCWNWTAIDISGNSPQGAGCKPTVSDLMFLRRWL